MDTSHTTSAQSKGERLRKPEGLSAALFDRLALLLAYDELHMCGQALRYTHGMNEHTGKGRCVLGHGSERVSSYKRT